MKTNYTNEDAKYIQDNLNVEGFEVKVAVAGDYFRLEFEGMLIDGDSANSDLYDTETAICAFNDVLENVSKRWIGVVKAAITKGFTFCNPDLDTVLVDAENYIINATPFEERNFDVVGDFWNNFRGQSQSLEWYDEDGECCTAQWGQIIADRYQDRSYYRREGNKLTPAQWFESEDENVFVYLDTVVTTKGEVVTLIA